MPHQVIPSCYIRIYDRDPAREQIAADLADLGGIRHLDSEFLFGFRTAARRDEALRAIRGSFGLRSAEPVDQEPPAAPQRSRRPARAARKGGSTETSRSASATSRITAPPGTSPAPLGSPIAPAGCR